MASRSSRIASGSESGGSLSGVDSSGFAMPTSGRERPGRNWRSSLAGGCGAGNGLSLAGERVAVGMMIRSWMQGAAAVLMTAGFCASVNSMEPSSFTAEVPVAVGYRFLLALPEGYEADAGKQWPLVVFLHGAGERGDDLEAVKKHGPLKELTEGRKIPAIIAAPQCPEGSVWNAHGVKALADHVAAKHRVDPRRVLLTGLSMGGFGTWETVIEYPDAFAAIAPICGGAGPRTLAAARIAHVPCWIFHGDADNVVTADFSRRMHDLLTKAGGQPRLTLYPDVGHDSWTQTYASDEFWEWLLAQRRDQ
jgi:poly(3-hydroxybutyrate) depolymerase